MKQIDFEVNNYEHKEDLKTFVSSLNDLVDKYIKSYSNADAPLKKVINDIDKKEKSIVDLNENGRELAQREEELKKIKEYFNNIIKELTARKKVVSYNDGEVQKLEIEDINSQIAAKRSQISKSEAKLATTKEKIKSNGEAIKKAEKELKDLLENKKKCEENLYRTESLLKLVETTKEMFNDSVGNILASSYVEPKKEEPKVVPKKDTEKPKAPKKENKFNPEKYHGPIFPDGLDNIDFDGKTVVKKTRKELEDIDFDGKTVVKKTRKELEDIDFDGKTVVKKTRKELEDIDFDGKLVVKKGQKAAKENAKRDKLKAVFAKEPVNFSSFSKKAQDMMMNDIERVKENLEILKKHSIPLDLTADQSEIYYNIAPQDLEDLLNIITVDADGNGMGFTIDFAFNILNELANINVDKLIDVYNNEFMNVTSKTGLISLLKMANPNLGTFEMNKKANMDTLKTLGINTTNEIAFECPEFINLDNPLFLNALNLFDKTDLVEKLNSDIKIVPKLLDYWKNN